EHADRERQPEREERVADRREPLEVELVPAAEDPVEGDLVPGEERAEAGSGEHGGANGEAELRPDPVPAGDALRPREPDDAVLEVEEDRRGERDPDQPGDEIEPAGVEQAAEDAGVEDVVADDEAACLRLTVDAARDVLLDVEIRSMDPGRHE